MKDKLTFRVLQASQPKKMGTFYASAAHEGVIVVGGHQGNDAFYCWSVGGRAFKTRSGRALKTQRVTGIAPFGEGSFILGNWEKTWILDARTGKAEELIGKPSFFEPDEVNDAFAQNRKAMKAYEHKTLEGRMNPHDHFQGSFWLFYTYLTADDRAPEVVRRCSSSRSPWVRDVAALIERALAGDASSKALKLLRARRGVIEVGRARAKGE